MRQTRHATRLIAAVVAVGTLVIVGLVVGQLSVAAADQKVTIIDFAFQPGSVTVTAGEVVTWQNTGATQHTVTADDGGFDSGPIGTGEQFAHLYDAAGTFTYHCSIHTNMTGTVKVLVAPITPTPSGPLPPTPPPGTLPPNFSRHPETPTPEPTASSTASSVVVAPPSAAVPTPSAAVPTSTASSPTGSSSDATPLLLVVVGLAIVAVAVGGWMVVRRRQT